MKEQSNRTDMATSPPSQPAVAARDKLLRSAQAKRGLIIFFAVVIPLSSLFGALTATTGHMLWFYPLMWTPTLAAIVARVALREGFTDISFHSGGQRGWQAILSALLFPTVVGLVAYGSAWAAGLAQFVEPTGTLAELGKRVIGAPPASPAVVFIAALLMASTYGTVMSAITATGEEIGWRGYMLTRLVDAGVPHSLLVSGLIWALWHVPLILIVGYAAGPSPILSAAIFVVGISAMGYVIGRTRLETGSVWPAIVLHAAWNSIIQGVFDPATTGVRAKLWTGESGVLVSLTLVVVAILLARRPWTMLRQPLSRTSRHIPIAATDDLPA
jgi:uncharacterized protein